MEVSLEGRSQPEISSSVWPDLKDSRCPADPGLAHQTQFKHHPLMAHKKTPTPKAEAVIRPIGQTSYVILPDNTIARKLKPTVINGIPKWNLGLSAGKTKRIGLEDLESYLQALELAKLNKTQP